jgi:hypothetical protein
VSFINPGAGITPVPAGDIPDCCDIFPEVGMSGTPVIDPSTGTLYVIVKTKESGAYKQHLHALDVATGAEKFGGPVEVRASVQGSGAGSSAGQIQFDPLLENQRSALLLANGVVYASFGGHGDYAPHHGWLIGYDANTLKMVVVYNTTPNGQGGGVWMGGGGPATDSSGSVYFTSSSGTSDAIDGGTNFWNTFIKINPDGTVVDYFTPYDQSNMDLHKWDLGSAGVLLLPDQSGARPHLMLGSGGTGSVYLIDRDNMGRFNPANDSQIVQTLENTFPDGGSANRNESSPVYFNGSVYFSAGNDNVVAFSLANGLLSTLPISRSSTVHPSPSVTMAASANGASNGILWVVESHDPTAPGILHAYNPANLAEEYYNSTQAAARDGLGAPVKSTVPVIANGKVFVTTDGQLAIYGLLP